MVRSLMLITALAVALLGATDTTSAQDATPGAGALDVALYDVEGQEVGRATLSEASEGDVMISVEIEGLPPGEHGIHVHGVGICDPSGDTPFASAGGHYNPTGATHGGPPTGEETGTPVAEGAMASPAVPSGHAGDLGNITVDEDGKGTLSITTDRFRLAELSDADGSALVIHADRDDLQTDPSGNSGARIVCGVIAPSTTGATPVASPSA